MFTGLVMVVYFMMFIFSIFLIISGSSWLGAWVGMELNVLFFIPLMLMKSSLYVGESALKYFLVQALSSVVMLFGFVIYVFKGDYIIVLISLLIKLGMAPFHLWVPSLVQGMSWKVFFFFLTFQKVGPLFVLMEVLGSVSKYILNVIVLVGSLVGSFGGINQFMLRKLLVYSSINHLSWMFVSMLVSKLMFLVYLFLYFLMNMSLIFFLSVGEMYSLVDVSLVSFDHQFLIFMNMLSLGGMPPMIGFVLKVWLLKEMIFMNCVQLIPVLFFSTVVTLYFYIRAVFPGVLLGVSSIFRSVGYGNMLLSVFGFVVLNIFGLLFPKGLMMLL